MEYVIIALLAVLIILVLVLILKIKPKDTDSSQKIENLRNDFRENEKIMRTEIGQMTSNSVKSLGTIIIENQKNTDEMQSKKLSEINENIIQKQDASLKAITSLLSQFEQRFKTFSVENEQKLDNIRGTVEKRLEHIQEENEKKLDKMREIVDEKLQKTLEERMTQSFKLVNDRLEQVYKGLGEMQNLAVGVGDLKKVLSNVKTRGILGEIQLGAILEEILSPEQYDTNVATKKGSKNVVEYAVKLPSDDDTIVYLPIDSKFPGDAYANLRDAYDSTDSEKVNAALKVLISTIKSEAKDIHDKYIDPPYTTEFAIMFLPFEGLYSEVVNRGLVEVLQREYRVNIAGPSTMAALLNSLQMGFKTLAIQKRSGEVWTILGAVKTEFNKFSSVLAITQQRLEQANNELDKLVGVRTRQMQRKLKDVTALSDVQSSALLDEAPIEDIFEE